MHEYKVLKVDATAVATAGPWIPCDININPFNVAIAGIIGSAGSGTYRFEHTLNNVFDTTEPVRAFVHEDISAQSTDADGNYAFPVCAIRLVVVSAASAMSVRYVINQAGT